ncbi:MULTISPECIES: alpha/beta hydrolase [unclassified Lentimonas]|uniref:alpha/beta hydrolase n=1 Tax=unclassified Lentimonas TaxID=2630993 RepID=UPI0013230C49|nr:MULTISPECIES: alpha/beta hydrolase [unclassified Lentimonas]CAA6676251.1 probable lipase/esterase [Lentimonas sp. CC4]CAA6683862.1 probable lipase/esterase [Lentimonas sp. CC6]CAA6692745.1 probable lipase/esterase [Lentimonas sp. CC10]CAA6696689.1 probable lipase/esterase [Lentimonas sp. CC19]CAA7072331.1 probable lipase/esterase [Lentimonas sp. CC11]
MKYLTHTLTPLLALLSVVSVHALEPLKDSSDLYNEIQVQKRLASLDKNQDGLIQADEYGDQWKRNGRHDTNKDGALDIEELRHIPLAYIDSPGKQLRNVLFKRTEDADVFLDFYFPDVDDSSEKPVVIYTHGGGWAAGSKHGAGNASFNVVHKALLKEGFCVLSVGYRLVKKGGDTAMRDCVIDAKDALRFVSAYRKELGIDPNKIYTFGDSAGGHLAQMVLLAPPESLQGDPELAKYSYKTVAGVSWYGPCDFEDEQLFNHDDRENFRDRFGPRIMGSDTGPQDKLGRYREMSPVNYLTKDSPALLMIQGDGDTTIPVKQAYRMEQALETIDAPVEIMIIKNAGHNWRQADGKTPIEPGRTVIIQSTIDFILEHK